MDSIKDVARSSVKVPEFDKHLKKAGRHISRTVVEVTIEMKTIVQKPLMIKIIKLHLRNSVNSNAQIKKKKKRNTIKMKDKLVKKKRERDKRFVSEKRNKGKTTL